MEIRNQLTDKLSVLKGNKYAAADIADLYESAGELITMIDNSISSDQSVDELQSLIIDILIHLDHIKWHHRSLKKRSKRMLKTR